jgi:hypothetical protein
MSVIWKRLVEAMCQAVRWGDRRLPRGVRSLVGVLFVLGGAVGFLPIVGFWMLPAGVALIALDIPPLRRRLLAWMERQEVKWREDANERANRDTDEKQRRSRR